MISPVRIFLTAGLIAGLLAVCMPHLSYAQGMTDEETDIYDENQNKHYMWPDIKNISKMYWTVGMFELTDDLAIDEFIRIHECKLFTEYFSNEFEWKNIREAMREDLKKNRKTFPLRFKFMQPLKLGRYNEEKEVFEIAEPYKIKGARRFQIMPLDHRNPVCTTARLTAYPRTLAIELSRPVTMLHIPISKNLATQYIEDRAAEFNAKKKKTEEQLFMSRSAYLVMMIKMFDYKGYDHSMTGTRSAKILGVLEGFEVYADRDMKQLLYVKYFRNRAKQPLKPTLSKPSETIKPSTRSATPKEPASDQPLKPLPKETPKETPAAVVPAPAPTEKKAP